MMTNHISSRFSILSKNLGAGILAHDFSWPVTEAVAPNDQIDHHVTFYELPVGSHSRMEEHLDAVKQTLLKEESALSKLADECRYTLWVQYRFPNQQGAFNLPHSLLSAFAFLRIEIIFHLNEF